MLKISKNNVEQTIDLEEAFDFDFTGNQALREIIAEKILDLIRKRSESGIGMDLDDDGNGLPVKLKSPYSKKYQESPEFKAWGKKKDKVNMRLTGDMLELMDIKRQDANSITIGWNERSQNPKAYNHLVGDTVPVRPFFGVSKQELEWIKEHISDDLNRAKKIKESEGKKQQKEFLVGLIDDLRKEMKRGKR